MFYIFILFLSYLCFNPAYNALFTSVTFTTQLFTQRNEVQDNLTADVCYQK